MNKEKIVVNNKIDKKRKVWDTDKKELRMKRKRFLRYDWLIKKNRKNLTYCIENWGKLF